MKVTQLLTSLLPTFDVYAHCDIPCGIYDPHNAQTAAKTVLKMVQKIKELEHPEKNDTQAHLNYDNNLTRMILTKEEHGRLCKNELFILWADYFKPEHLEKFPDLHDKFWKAVKLVSKNKQSVDEDLANQLVAAVDEIADMFHQTQDK